MKLKDSVTKEQLEELGFYLYQENEYEYYYSMENKMIYEIGHSRRGQFYYLIVNKSNCIEVFATEPDGSGGSIELANTLLKMFKLGYIEESEDK